MAKKGYSYSLNEKDTTNFIIKFVWHAYYNTKKSICK